MITNPMCDMPWDIYLDYLADQGCDQLREINLYSFNSSLNGPYYRYHDPLQFNAVSGYIDGDGDEYNYYFMNGQYNIDDCAGCPVKNGYILTESGILFGTTHMGDDNMEYGNSVDFPGCGI